MKIQVDRFVSDSYTTASRASVEGSFACFDLEDEYRAKNWSTKLESRGARIVCCCLPPASITSRTRHSFRIFIAGAAETTALVVKVFSGVLSARLGKRKPLTPLGYGLARCPSRYLPCPAAPGWLSPRAPDRPRRQGHSRRASRRLGGRHDAARNARRGLADVRRPRTGKAADRQARESGQPRESAPAARRLLVGPSALARSSPWCASPRSFWCRARSRVAWRWRSRH